MGKKDIIKIDSPMEVDLDVLGYIDPNITVNIIRDGKRVEKKHLELPQKLVNIIHCKNPRCITVAEPQLDAIFLLSDPEKHTYRCAYCDTAEAQALIPQTPQEERGRLGGPLSSFADVRPCQRRKKLLQ